MTLSIEIFSILLIFSIRLKFANDKATVSPIIHEKYLLSGKSTSRLKGYFFGRGVKRSIVSMYNNLDRQALLLKDC